MKLITKAIESKLAKHPIYSQDGKGADAKVIVKFFIANYTWYVLEGERLEDGDWLFFGITDNAAYGEHEYGYFTLSQIEHPHRFLPTERDLYFNNKTVRDIVFSF